MFDKSGEIASELQTLNSFARMKKPSKDAKKIMYKEAAEILGYKLDEAEIDEKLDEILKIF
jgi:hypothetical protein